MKHGTAAAGEVIGLAVKTVLCGNLLGRGGRGVPPPPRVWRAALKVNNGG